MTKKGITPDQLCCIDHAAADYVHLRGSVPTTIKVNLKTRKAIVVCLKQMGKHPSDDTLRVYRGMKVVLCEDLRYGQIEVS